MFLVTMVTHNFPTKWVPWQPQSCDMLTISVFIKILNTGMVNIGTKVTKLESEVALFRNIVSNFT